MIFGACCGVMAVFLVFLEILGVILGALGDPLDRFWEALGVICEPFSGLWLFFVGFCRKTCNCEK